MFRTDRLAHKAKSLRADVRVLAPMARSPVRLLPWLLTSGRGPIVSLQVHEFEFRGIQFAVRPRDLLGLREIFVDDEYGFVGQLLPQTPTVVDLGANAGLFAVLVLAERTSATVHSYEPSRETFAVLAGNRARNPTLDWHCHQLAGSSGPGTVRFANHPLSTGSRVSEDGAERVATIGLQGILEHVGRPVDLMKVDIEGSEESLLIGQEALLDSVGTLVIELHPDHCDTEAVLACIKRSYPRVRQIHGRRSAKPLIVATR